MKGFGSHLASCGFLAWATAAAAFSATVVQSPFLQDLRPDGVTILWSTEERGRGVVELSAAGSGVRSSVAEIREFLPPDTSRPFFQYRARLSALEPGREYVYSVRVDGELIRGGVRFRTPGSGPFTFLVFGDSGNGEPAQKQLAGLMLSREDPAFVLHVGDLSQQEGTVDQLNATYFGAYAGLMEKAPFYPAPGNHDYYTDFAGPYLRLHALPASGVPPEDAGRYYSFDWGNVHFVILDSNLLEFPEPSARMLKWLQQDLASQNSPWKIVTFHHPAYPIGHHYDELICDSVRRRIVPVMERYGVQLVLNGHEHIYQRTLPLRGGLPAESGPGTVYLISGGGGGGLHAVGEAPLAAAVRSIHHYLRIEVQGSRMTVAAIDIEGKVMDRVYLAQGLQTSIEGVVNAATFTGALSPGSLVSIFGTNLAFGESRAAGLPLPSELSGTYATLEGKRIPLLYVSPAQVNAQLPYGPAGTAALRVHTAGSSADAAVVLAEAAPAILSVARTGDVASVYAVGLGPLDAAVEAGQAAPATPQLKTLYPVEVHLGGVSLTPSFAGLAPGFTGVYQVNVALPGGLESGGQPLRLAVKGVFSEPARLPAASLP